MERWPWSIKSQEKSDENETGVCSLIWHSPKPRMINDRGEEWING
jgi:hypothetical protein